MYLPYAEFYITNVCNYSCHNCNRFNNYDFKGSYKWDNSYYEKWASKTKIRKINILGGEPTLNPNLPNFVLGISKLWPDTTNKRINTNGANLKSKLLHKLLKRYNWRIELNLHDLPPSKINKHVIQELNKHWGPLKLIKRTRKKVNLMTKRDENTQSFGDNMVTQTRMETSLGVVILINEMTEFHENAFIDKENMILYDSDPNDAHKHCTMKTCHHFIDGKLYKCGVVKLVPDIMKQKNLSYPSIYDQYKPLDDNSTQQDLDNLAKNSIPQCTHCPGSEEEWKLKRFKLDTKGNKFKR